eukprot:scaffold89936_cov59-Attheya_sp.AAC.3
MGEKVVFESFHLIYLDSVGNRVRVRASRIVWGNESRHTFKQESLAYNKYFQFGLFLGIPSPGEVAVNRRFLKPPWLLYVR